MVFLNYSTMQMVAKIVYYGPGLCGKTTNLKAIYRNTDERARGEMVSLATETDRTLFFDLLPMEVGVIGGFKTKFQLYTVPGQVFYNTTRKLVLRGVDGIVFVADSQMPMMEANQESLMNLKENLEELNLDINNVPLVLQYNKRDLPNVASLDQMNRLLNTMGKPYVEASALNGVGVFETLREVSKETLLILNQKSQGNKLESSGEEPKSIDDSNASVMDDSLEKSLEESFDDIPEDVSFDDEPLGAPPAIEDSDTFSEDLNDPEQDLEGENFEKTLDHMELDFDEDDEFDADVSDFDDFDDDADEPILPEMEMDGDDVEIVEDELEIPEVAEDDDEPIIEVGEDLISAAALSEPDDFAEPPPLPQDEPIGEAAYDVLENLPELDDDEPLSEPQVLEPPEEEDPQPDFSGAEPFMAEPEPLEAEPLSLEEPEPLISEPLDLDEPAAPILEDQVDLEPPALDEPAPSEPAPMTYPEDDVDEVLLEDEGEDDMGLLLEEDEEPVDLLTMDEPKVEESAPPSAPTSPPTPPVQEIEIPVPKPKPRPKPVKKPASSGGTLDALEDLKSLTRTVSTRSVGPKKKKTGSVDSLLSGLVDDKKPKPKQPRIQVKAPFENVQLNCVFTDADDNVVDTKLVKVDHERISAGKARVKVVLEIDIDQN